MPSPEPGREGRPPVVLIGFADALAAPEVVFSLRHAGFAVRPFTREGAPPASIARLPVEPALLLPAPEADADAAIAALRAGVAEMGAEAPPAAILPLDDAALWLVDRAFGPAPGSPGGPGGRAGPPVAGATGALAEVALDKTRQIALATQAGFAVPPTTVARGRAEILAHDRFPAIVKPALAAELRGAGLRRGSSYYLMSAADLARLPPDERLSYPALVQPLIAGQGEGIFGFATAEGITAWSGHRRVRMMNPHGSGASACRLNPVEPGLREAAMRMLSGIGWRGPFMIELLRDAAGTAQFMELNGRLWGSTALVRRAGLDYPAWAVAHALDPEFSPPEITPGDPGTVRHLGRDLLHLLFLLKGPQSDFHRAHWPRFWPALGAVLSPAPGRQFYNWDPAHRWFHLRDAAATVGGFLGRRR
jgi:hypothetical protein